ncbi:hypothetical protein BJF80_02130 [Serinicoccus sp. CUA-874]|uniref:hypothetical protein n=1 Tax=Serinicoccus sp. CUA-874 TaxID=1517939 RepID=UPI00096A0D10|nr:hypothetical protein [Serinicoccus sp. CUA-874]OLT18097.1 hypothetical protein BJF80_02130 [Serinicoccus sp. CUA-874]
MGAQEEARGAPRPLTWPGMALGGVLSAVAFDDPQPSGDPWHRGIPGNALTLIIGTGEPFLVGGGTSGPPTGGRALPSLVGGLQTQGAWTRQQGRWSGVHLALDPLAARGLLGIPAAELAPGADGHTTVEADAVLPRGVRALADRLASAGTAEQAATLAAWARARPAPPPR